MPPVKTTPPITPALVQTTESVQLTEDQKRRAFELVAKFNALAPGDRDRLRSELQDEVDPRLLAEIERARKLLEVGHVNIVERTGAPAKIDDIAKACGWTEDSWQLKLLRALDGAGQFEKDGMVMASEIITGLRAPESPQYLTSASVERLVDLVSKKANDPAAGALIDDLKSAWEEDLAIKADLSGNHDQRVTKDEIRAYLASNPDGINKLALQNIGIMLHQIAQVTHEPDPFRVLSRGTDLAVVKSAYIGSLDRRVLIPTVIGQLITASDLIERGKIERANKFYAEPDVSEELRVSPSIYGGSGEDLGHVAAAGDAATVTNEAMSYSTLNMLPEEPKLNRFSWRYLEDAVRDLIVDTGARAMVKTGPLFLDDQGKPMKPDDPRVRTISKTIRGKLIKVPIPTHVFKTALLEMPGGRYSTVGYIIENKPTLPTDEKECMKLIRGTRTPTGSGRASIEEIERLVEPDGSFKAFEGFLPEGSIGAELRADKTSAVAIKDPTLKAAQFLWEPGATVKDWSAPSVYDVDASLEVIGQRMAKYQVANDGGAELIKLRDAIANAGTTISRSEVKRIVIAARIDWFTPEQCHEARSMLKQALERTHDRNAHGPLNSLIRRVERQASQPPQPPGGQLR